MRNDLSNLYITGTGLEIAAFHNPWPHKANVIYLDCITNEKLRKQFPEVAHKEFSNIHVLDDANYLKSIPDESMEFVISSHVFEHMENVGIALQNWLRVLKKGKHLVMAIPLKHNPIDKDRVPTSLSHVVKEFEDPLSFDLEAHYLEYYRDCCDKLRGDKLDYAIQTSISTRANIHFHCWEYDGIFELFMHFRDRFNYDISVLQHSGHEVFVALKKL